MKLRSAAAPRAEATIRYWSFGLVLAAIVFILPAQNAGGGNKANTVAPQAQHFVAPDGSDESVCTRTNPCLTFNRAYHVARPGEIVEVAAGTYGQQTIGFDPTKRSTKRVVFRPVPGANITMTNSVIIESSHIEFDNFPFGYAIYPGDTADYSYGLRIDVPNGDGGQYACISDITIKNANGHAFAITNGVTHVRIIGGAWGNYGEPNGGKKDWEDPSFGFDAGHHCPDSSTVAPPMKDVVVSGVRVGNLFQGCRDVGQACAAPSHPDCLQFTGAVDGITFKNNRIEGCFGTYFMGDAEPGFGPMNNIVWENNFFGDDTPSAAHSAQFDDKGNPKVTCNRMVFRHNSFAYSGAGLQFTCRPGRSGDGIRLTANIFAVGPSGDCKSAAPYYVSYSDNVFASGRICGKRGRGVPYGYTLVDGRLRPDRGTSPVITATFGEASQGWSPRRIARRLRKRRFTSPTGRTWTANDVISILRDHVYSGGIYGVSGAHPALVSRSRWHSAQRAVRKH